MVERRKLLEQITMRLDNDLLARLETYARRLENRSGLRLSRCEVARQLLMRGLDAIESMPVASTVPD